MPKTKSYPNDIHFVPGGVLGPWLEQYRKKHGFRKSQEAIRDILRARMLQDVEAKKNNRAQEARA